METNIFIGWRGKEVTRLLNLPCYLVKPLLCLWEQQHVCSRWLPNEILLLCLGSIFRLITTFSLQRMGEISILMWLVFCDFFWTVSSSKDKPINLRPRGSRGHRSHECVESKLHDTTQDIMSQKWIMSKWYLLAQGTDFARHVLT